MEPQPLVGQKVTLQYDRCRLLGSNYRYEWLAELGECPSGESFYAEFSANFVYGTSLKYYYTFFRIVLRKDGQEYNICETRSEDIEWTEPKTVADGVQVGATIGDEGKPPGLWCNGYDDMSVVLQICKIKDNWGAYDDGGYYFPNACSSSKGATELICSLDLDDFVIDSASGNHSTTCTGYSYNVHANLALLSSASLRWTYKQCGNYEKGFGASIPIQMYNEVFEADPSCWQCDRIINNATLPSEPLLQIYWFLNAKGSQSMARIVNDYYGCMNDYWLIYETTMSPNLPDCDDYTGTSATSALGTITVNETVYCEIPS